MIMKQNFEVGDARFVSTKMHGLYEQYIVAARAYFDLPNEYNWDQKEDAFARYNEIVRNHQDNERL
jgi:hypothetical protein